MRGVYASSYQGDSDYDQAAAAGVEFVIVKLTDGVGYRNPRRFKQASEARANNLLLGFFAFWRQADGDVDQARAFWLAAVAIGWQRGAPLFLDVEKPDDETGDLPPNTGDRVYECLVSIEEMSGVTPGLYVNRSDAARFCTDPRFARFPLWLAAWGEDLPDPPYPWERITIWQSAPSWQVPGLGECTVEQFDGTSADWAVLGGVDLVQPEQPAGGALMEPVITERTDWGGAGVIVEESVIVRNPGTGVVYQRRRRAGVMQPWEIVL